MYVIKQSCWWLITGSYTLFAFISRRFISFSFVQYFFNNRFCVPVLCSIILRTLLQHHISKLCFYSVRDCLFLKPRCFITIKSKKLAYRLIFFFFLVYLYLSIQLYISSSIYTRHRERFAYGVSFRITVMHFINDPKYTNLFAISYSNTSASINSTDLLLV